MRAILPLIMLTMLACGYTSSRLEAAFCNNDCLSDSQCSDGKSCNKCVGSFCTTESPVVRALSLIASIRAPKCSSTGILTVCKCWDDDDCQFADCPSNLCVGAEYPERLGACMNPRVIDQPALGMTHLSKPPRTAPAELPPTARTDQRHSETVFQPAAS